MVSFLSHLEIAARDAAEQTRKLSKQIKTNEIEGEAEYEATYRAILYYELRNAFKIRTEQLSLETGFRDDKGKLIHADLAYCPDGVWTSQKDDSMYVIQIAPVSDSKRGPALRAHSKKKIQSDTAKLKRLAGKVGHRVIVVPFIGVGPMPHELSDERSLQLIVKDDSILAIPC